MKNKRADIFTALLVLLPCIYSGSVLALQIKGIDVPQQITQSVSKQSLTLNGAGIRTKFFFDIYVGALYLSNQSKDVSHILNVANSKRISMHFLYDKIEKEKMTNGWTEAFEDNLTEAQFTTMKPEIEAFNSAFGDTVKDDVVIIDFISNKETIITINDIEKARISGADFQRALLSVWLGESPVDEDLKQAMLGVGEE